MRLSKTDSLIAARVALLKCRREPQSAIAKRLGLGEATVSRLLQEGGAAARYIKPPEFDWSLVDANEKAELRAIDDVEGFSQVLTERLKGISAPPRRIAATVVLTKTGASDEDVQRSALPSDFYDGAVRAVWELLTPANVIGITWGHTLSLLLRAARKARVSAHYSGEHQPLIIPLCGESLGAILPSTSSSSALAQGFGEVLTTRAAGEYLSLGMIPVLLPGPNAFSDTDVDAVKKLLGFAPAYTMIFGTDKDKDRDDSVTIEKERPLAEKLDVVITSISREGQALGVGDHPGFTWNTLQLSEFAKLVIGDLAGIPLVRPGVPATAIAPLLKRWTGLKEHHLHLCAERASAPANAPTGVVVIGTGRERTACILEAVRRGLVNHIVVDEELGRALIERLT